ncbi:MAG TPA: PQQ-binding-like beta-propeller repeat protein, partial [Fibrella sp.]
GQVKWSFLTNFDIYGTPLVTNGSVYIGSADFRLYALNARTGTLRWQYRTGGVLLSSPVLPQRQLIIGTYPTVSGGNKGDF